MSGNSMFNNFTNLNTTYTPNPFQLNYPQFQQSNNGSNATPINPNKPYEILSADRSTVIGYFWYYRNSVDLIFDITGEVTSESTLNYVDVSEILNTLKLEATIYNFRHESILKFSNDFLISKNEIKIDGTSAILSITNELSNSLVKGKYCLELNAMHPNGYCETLFNSEMNNLYFEVR